MSFEIATLFELPLYTFYWTIKICYWKNTFRVKVFLQNGPPKKLVIVGIEIQELHCIIEEQFLFDLFVFRISFANRFSGISSGESGDFSQRKRVICSEHDPILSDDSDQKSERVRIVNERIRPEFSEKIFWRNFAILENFKLFLMSRTRK